VPIWPEANRQGPPIGILGLAIRLDSITSELKLDFGDDMQLAVIDVGRDTLEGDPARGLILQHPNLYFALDDSERYCRLRDPDLLERLCDLRALAWKTNVSDATSISARDRQKLSICKDFHDPLKTPGTQMITAAFAAVVISEREVMGAGDVGWVVVIQDVQRERPNSSGGRLPRPNRLRGRASDQ
jgi:hypothetical protein